MLKKNLSPKPTKTISKISINDKDINMPYPIHIPKSQTSQQIIRLQKMLTTQINQRIKSQNNILQKIKHLQITKKSKLPSKPNPQFLNKLSPTKHHAQTQHQQQCKNLILSIKSERQASMLIKQQKFCELRKQIDKIKQQVNQVGILELSINQVKSMVKDYKAEIMKIVNDDTMKLENQINYIRSDMQNVLLTVKQWVNNCMQEQYIKINTKQQDIIQKMENKFKQRIDVIEKCIFLGLESLKKVQIQANKAFQQVTQKVKVASQSIIETKQSLEETFYGSEYRSRDKLESQISIDFTPNNTKAIWPRKIDQTTQKLQHYDKRVQMLERRIDFLYTQYLTQPFTAQKQ